MLEVRLTEEPFLIFLLVLVLCQEKVQIKYNQFSLFM